MSFHDAKLKIASVNIIIIPVQRGNALPLFFETSILGTKRTDQKKEWRKKE